MKTSIIVDGVTYYRDPPDLTKAKRVVEKWEWIKSFINDGVLNAQALYDNMKAEGLNVGMIEAEGYLRCAKTMLNQIAHIDECVDEDIFDGDN